MASIRAIQVGNRKGLKIELGGFKEARDRFLKAVSAMDEVSSSSAKTQVILEFSRIATDFRNALRSSASAAGVAKRVYKAIFASRIENKRRVSVLAGVSKRVAAKYPSSKNGGLRLEWRDFTSKAGDSKGKRVSMSLSTAFNQGTKKTKATGFFDRVYTVQRPIMLTKMIDAYKRVING